MPLSKEEMRKAFYGDEGKGKKLGLSQKIKMVITSPSRLFEAVKSESDLTPSFKYLAVISLIFIVIQLLISSLFISTAAPAMGFSMVGMLGAAIGAILAVVLIVVWIMILLLSFTGVGITHLFVRLLGGKGNYCETYKAYAYSSTPLFLFGWIPYYIGLVFFVWFIYLYIKGLSRLHNIGFIRALVALFLPVIIIAAVVVGFAFLFSFGMFSAIQSGAEAQAQSAMRSQVAAMQKMVKIDNAIDDKLYIRNVGTSDISTSELSVFVDRLPATCNWDINSFGGGEMITCTLSEPCSNKAVSIIAPGNEDGMRCS